MAASIALETTPIMQRTDALIARIDQATESLLARFSSITSLSMEDEDQRSGGRNASTAAASSLQIENHADRMVVTAQELRTIIREVKEAWITGSQHDVHASSTPEKEEEEEEEEEEGLSDIDIDAQVRTTLMTLGGLTRS